MRGSIIFPASATGMSVYTNSRFMQMFLDSIKNVYVDGVYVYINFQAATQLSAPYYDFQFSSSDNLAANEIATQIANLITTESKSATVITGSLANPYPSSVSYASGSVITVTMSITSPVPAFIQVTDNSTHDYLFSVTSVATYCVTDSGIALDTGTTYDVIVLDGFQNIITRFNSAITT
ncbi:MAG: hypothetical protein WCI55_08120 [Armatimonadota bacterium]